MPKRDITPFAQSTNLKTNEELENWIFHNLHPVDYTVTKPATQFVVTITIGENQFVGQDANKTQAVAKAILAALN